MNGETKTLLAIDTATSGCSVCVWRANQGEGQVLAQESLAMARGQAQELMVMVDRVLVQAGVEPADLSAVAVTRGPGAFTGLRIALATAKGFALAVGVPCVGVTTLEAIAAAVPSEERAGTFVLTCVESKREDLYVQLFDADLAPLSEPMACNAQALQDLVGTGIGSGAPLVLVGDAAQRAHDMLQSSDATLSDANPLPNPAHIARIAAARLGDNPPMPQPLYLRPPDAKLPKNQGRLRT